MSSLQTNSRTLMIAAVAGICLLASAVSAEAQTGGSPGQASYLTTPAFASLINGKSIVVWTKDGREYEGHFTVSGDSLVMARELTTTTVPFTQIARVQKSTDRIRFHGLIGLGVGALVGIKVAHEACEGACAAETYWPFMLIGGGVGIGVGARVGFMSNLRNFWDDMIYDVYNAGTRTRTLAVAPVVSRTRKGLAVILTWR